jgi:hypothetical protein
MLGANNPLQHPLQSASSAIGAAGLDPRPMQNASLFQGANEGPAKVASKITGMKEGGKRVDDGPYFTNNEAIPWPDAAHSKTVGGLPLASDVFLFQKQQHFNRSKLLERKAGFYHTVVLLTCVLPCITLLTAISPRHGPSLRQRGFWIFRDHKRCVRLDQGSVS